MRWWHKETHEVLTNRVNKSRAALWSWNEISGMVVTIHVLSLTRNRNLNNDIKTGKSWSLGLEDIRNSMSWIQLSSEL